jgi:hypothetical protein
MPTERAFSQGQELLGKRQVLEALPYFDEAQRLGYATRECAAARWQCWMLLGEFEKAWKESDFIITCGSADPNRLWDGQSWSGRRVLLRCLHGLGDTIQFIRYAPLLRQSCAQLTVQVHPELVSLLEGVSGIDRVCTWGGDTSDWDLEMEVTELPRAFRTIQSTIPSTVPYIQVSAELIRRAETWIEQSRELRVGVVWEASSWDTSRFIPAVELTPILSCKHCQFYSLQKNVDCVSTASLGAIVDLWPRLSDVRDTAALIRNLDLIVTVDSMVAHLAGALGRPVWIMLPAKADWRWMLARNDTPWYPTARLFRQGAPGDWSKVIADVCASLSSAKSAYIS